MINPPKQLEGPKPTKADFTRFFQVQSPVPPPCTPSPPSPTPPSPPPLLPSTNNSVLATDGSTQPLLPPTLWI